MDGAQTVWLNLTQQQLDDAYDQSVYAPNREQVLRRYHRNSDETRKRLGSPREFCYGTGENETLQVFCSSESNSPVLIFIHGGAWRSGSASQYAFLADVFVQNGINLVLPDFDWVQNRDGDLLAIADQVERAIAWVAQRSADFSGDPERIYLSGHSSGAHLAAVTLTRNWRHTYKLPVDVIKGALLCSGLYDLTPVSLSARNQYVGFTQQVIERLSPIRMKPLPTPVVIAFGELETPEFKRQSIEMSQAFSEQSIPTEIIVAAEHNHFEILETLANPYGLLGEAALRLIDQR